jgi:hypothetical protein
MEGYFTSTCTPKEFPLTSHYNLIQVSPTIYSNPTHAFHDGPIATLFKFHPHVIMGPFTHPRNCPLHPHHNFNQVSPTFYFTSTLTPKEFPLTSHYNRTRVSPICHSSPTHPRKDFPLGSTITLLKFHSHANLIPPTHPRSSH